MKSTQFVKLPWTRIAAIFQIFFCGLILVGFTAWMFMVIVPIMEISVEPRYWQIPVMEYITQPIGSMIAIVGAFLLLKERKIGLYISMASVPILLISRTTQFMFGGLIWLPFIPQHARPPTQSDVSEIRLMIFVLSSIYYSCVGAMATLLAICLKANRFKV